MDKTCGSRTDPANRPGEDPQSHSAGMNVRTATRTRVGRGFVRGPFEQHAPRTRQVRVESPESTIIAGIPGCGEGKACVNKNREWVIAAVESIFEQIVDGILEDDKKLTITIRSRGRAAGQAFDHETRFIRPTTMNRTREISFPGSTPKEAWNFSMHKTRIWFMIFENSLYFFFPSCCLYCHLAVLVRILQLVHEALVSDTTTTKR
jgi:hypothetical protein